MGKIYLFDYVPIFQLAQSVKDEENAIPVLHLFGALILLAIDYYTLLTLAFSKGDGDPGHMSKAIQDLIFRVNGIDQKTLANEYDKKEAANICTYNFFVRQGLIRKDELSEEQSQTLLNNNHTSALD